MSAILNKSEQGTIVFLLFKSLKYSLRVVLCMVLIVTGLVLQFYYYSAFPGILVVLFGNLFLLVKGYDNRLKMGKLNPYSQWENISREQVDKLANLHKKIMSWDRSALDITNVLGFWMFFILALIVFILFINGADYFNKSYNILALNIIVLIIPHWFTGVRKILTKPILILKISLLNNLLSKFQTKISEMNIDFLVQLKGEKADKALPEDIKIKVSSLKDSEFFLGMYGQICVNDVNGAKYPYFYIVLVGKPEFNLKEKTKNYKPPLNLIKEYTIQQDVDVLVIRQFTTSTSGYHTNEKVYCQIFEEGLAVCNLLSVK